MGAGGGRTRGAAVALLILALGGQACARAPSPKPAASSAARRAPNVLFILTDQHRRDGVSAYGGGKVDTPSLDGLARAGIRFEHAYVAQPVCSPNRASLMTGLYPHAHGVIDNNVPLPTDTRTLAEHLSASGYSTGYFGKWHLGGKEGHGFQEFPDYPNDGRGKRHHFVLPDGSRRYGPAVITDDAIAFMHKQKQRPFFTFVSYYPPHTPYDAPQPQADEYARRFPGDSKRAAYYANCAAVDEQVGRLLEALDEMDIAADTLVVFTTEHGHFFEQRWNDHAKRLCYDESARIPLLVRLPGRRLAGQVSQRPLVSAYLPGAIAFELGLPLPGVQRERFSDLSSLSDVEHPFAYMVNIPVEASPAETERCGADHRYKVILSSRRPPELYDRETDPEERLNRWEDPQLAAPRERLMRSMTVRAQELADPAEGVLEAWASGSRSRAPATVPPAALRSAPPAMPTR